MQRRRGSKRRPSSRSGLANPGPERIVTVSGSCDIVFTISVGAVVTSAVLNDSISGNILSLSDAYGLYRFTELEVMLPPNINVGATTGWPSIYGVGFTPEALLASPASFSQMIQMPFFAFQGLARQAAGALVFGGQSTSSFRVPRSALFHVGAKWFRTQGAGTEPDWETQGTFIAATDVAAVTGPTSFRCLLRYTCEFTDMLPTTVTRARMREQLAHEVADSLVSGSPATPGFSKDGQPPPGFYQGSSHPRPSPSGPRPP